MKLETAKALYVTLNKVSVTGQENLRNLLACINSVAQEMEELAKEEKEHGNNDNDQRDG